MFSICWVHLDKVQLFCWGWTFLYRKYIWFILFNCSFRIRIISAYCLPPASAQKFKCFSSQSRPSPIPWTGIFPFHLLIFIVTKDFLVFWLKWSCRRVVLSVFLFEFKRLRPVHVGSVWFVISIKRMFLRTIISLFSPELIFADGIELVLLEVFLSLAKVSRLRTYARQ